MSVDLLSLDAGRAKPFYVYLYRDPRPGKRGLPIYVGKGLASDGRAEYHWRRRALNPILAAILDKIRAAGLSPIIEIVSWFESEAEAFDLETALVAKFGRRDKKTGTLANMTAGGDGAVGHVPTARARAASAARLKKIRAAQWNDPNFRRIALKNLADGRRAALSDERIRKKRVAALRAAKAALAADPERWAKQSQQRRALRNIAWADEATREKYLNAIRAACPAKRAKMKTLWADPEYRAKHGGNVGAAAKAAWADPEKRRKRVEAMRDSRKRDAKATGIRSAAVWAADPERKAARSTAISAGVKAAWADPEKRRKLRDAIRAGHARRKMQVEANVRG